MLPRLEHPQIWICSPGRLGDFLQPESNHASYENTRARIKNDISQDIPPS